MPVLFTALFTLFIYCKASLCYVSTQSSEHQTLITFRINYIYNKTYKHTKHQKPRRPIVLGVRQTEQKGLHSLAEDINRGRHKWIFLGSSNVLTPCPKRPFLRLLPILPWMAKATKVRTPKMSGVVVIMQDQGGETVGVFFVCSIPRLFKTGVRMCHSGHYNKNI